jgi:hypothetical protein
MGGPDWSEEWEWRDDAPGSLWSDNWSEAEQPLIAAGLGSEVGPCLVSGPCARDPGLHVVGRR